MPVTDLLDGVVALVRQAGEAILPHWRTDLDVQEKADSSPVTAADLAANRVLVAGLQALAPDIPVLSEESCDVPLAERAHWTRWWLVDPLDGTKGFVSGGDEFTVNVALVEAGQVRFGVVGVPVSGFCYWGGKGLGAWLQPAAGEPWRMIQARQQHSGPLQVVVGRESDNAVHACLVSGLQQRVGDVERVGISSSLKFCLVAEGKADCYPRLGPTSQWDTAAAQGVVEGSGGLVLDLQGQPFRYAMAESYLNPYFLVLPAAASWREELIRLANTCIAQSL